MESTRQCEDPPCPVVCFRGFVLAGWGQGSPWHQYPTVFLMETDEFRAVVEARRKRFFVRESRPGFWVIAHITYAWKPGDPHPEVLGVPLYVCGEGQAPVLADRTAFRFVEPIE